MRYYIAARIENASAHNQVRDALNARGHEITYDWTSHGAVWHRGLEEIRRVAALEIKGVLDADFVVALLPGGRGTHVEVGAALGLGRTVFIHSTRPDEHFSAHPDTCAFYHHPLAVPLPSDIRAAAIAIDRHLAATRRGTR